MITVRYSCCCHLLYFPTNYDSAKNYCHNSEKCKTVKLLDGSTEESRDVNVDKIKCMSRKDVKVGNDDDDDDDDDDDNNNNNNNNNNME